MSGPRIEVNLANSVTSGVRTLRSLLERAVGCALEHEQVDDAMLSVTLVGDAQISQLNQQYLQHDGPTDVISFPLYEQGETPVGDIYIGYEQARRQAEELDIPLDAELARLAVHGTLHVLGYDHPDQDAREGSEMWQLQEVILQKVLHS